MVSRRKWLDGVVGWDPTHHRMKSTRGCCSEGRYPWSSRPTHGLGVCAVRSRSPRGAEIGAEIRLPPRFSAPTSNAVAAQGQGSEGQGRLAGMAPWSALLLMESACMPIAFDADHRLPAIDRRCFGYASHA